MTKFVKKGWLVLLLDSIFRVHDCPKISHLRNDIRKNDLIKVLKKKQHHPGALGELIFLGMLMQGMLNEKVTYVRQVNKQEWETDNPFSYSLPIESVYGSQSQAQKEQFLSCFPGDYNRPLYSSDENVKIYASQNSKGVELAKLRFNMPSENGNYRIRVTYYLAGPGVVKFMESFADNMKTHESQFANEKS